MPLNLESPSTPTVLKTGCEDFVAGLQNPWPKNKNTDQEPDQLASMLISDPMLSLYLSTVVVHTVIDQYTLPRYVDRIVS